MDSEIRTTPVAPARRGVAMFIVLGAILLVTLFGAVALTLAQRDQTLSGDLNDIKSRDEAALSGLQMAINRLATDPEVLLSVLNSFIDQSYAKNGKPDSVWLSLDSSTTLRLLDDEPEWFALSNLPGNQTATKVQLVAVQHADTTSEVKLDSTQIYVTLRCLARGRRGDEKSVQAAYRIHGITGDNKNDTIFFTIPQHSFYLGGRLAASNMDMQAEGGVYVGSAGNTFLNSGAGQTIDGDFQWNDNLQLNDGSDVHIRGNAVINGGLGMNSNVRLQVDGNLHIKRGFLANNSNSRLIVGGNAFIDAPTTAGLPPNWQSVHGIRVGGSLYLYPSNYDSSGGVNSPPYLIVGGDAWLVRSGTFTIGTFDSFYIGRNLFYGEVDWNHSFATTAGALYKIGGSLIAGRNSRVILPQSTVGDSVQVDTNLLIRPGQSLTVGSVYHAKRTSGTILGQARPAIPVTSMHWRTKPTPLDFGIPAALSNTAPADNPMDSVKVDALHSPRVNAALIPLAPLLPSGTISAPRLNAIYDSLRKAGKLLNGYMTLIVNSGATLNVAATPTTSFNGKMIVVVEGSITVNGNWPASQAGDNIQVILVRRKGNLGQFGWSGLFAGILYWENPCGNTTLSITANSVMRGAMLFGTSLTAPGFGYTAGELCSPGNRSTVTPNTGGVRIIRDLDVYTDIGRNLPGVLAPARDATGNPLSIQGTIDVWYYTPRLRLVHDRPFFEPLGVFR